MVTMGREVEEMRVGIAEEDLEDSSGEEWRMTRPRNRSRGKIVLGGIGIGFLATALALTLAFTVGGVGDGSGGSPTVSQSDRRSLIENPVATSGQSPKCDVVVETAQFFNVSRVAGTDSTVVTNKYNKRAYVLTPEWASDEAVRAKNLTELDLVPSDYETAYLRTPLRNVTVAETQLITFIELLGDRSAISSFSQYATSPCLNKMQEEGLATIFSGNVYDFSGSQLNGTGPTFVGYMANGDVAPETIQLAVSAEQKDGSMLATSEWIKFFAPFFGQECAANDIFRKVKERYECHKSKVSIFARDFDPIKVAVVQKSLPYDYGPTMKSDGYFKVSDAAYWSEYIKDAGATPLIETSAVDGLTASNGYVFNLSDPEGFHAVLQQADVVIDETYMQDITAKKIIEAYNITDVSKFKFIQNKALWRADRRINDRSPTGDDWFEARYPEADVLLEDIIFALHPTYSGLILNPRHSLTWMRNMYSAPAQEVLTSALCTDVEQPTPLIADECKSLNLN